MRLQTGEVRQPQYGTLTKLAGALQVKPAEFIRFVSDVGKPTALGKGMTLPEPLAYVGDTFSVPFTAVFERDGEWWNGYVEELPGANAQGESLQQCRESLRQAVSLVLEANWELTRRGFEGRDACATHGYSKSGGMYPADQQAGTPLSSTHQLCYRLLKYLAIGSRT